MFCKKCGRQIDDDWVACPKCGASTIQEVLPDSKKKEHSPTQKVFGVIAGIAVAFFTFSLLSSGGSNSTPAIPATPATRAAGQVTEANGLIITDQRSEAGQTKGDVKNVSEKTYRYIQVRIQYYDAGGKLVASRLSNAANLKPGETWAFSVYQPDGASTYKVEPPTGNW